MDETRDPQLQAPAPDAPDAASRPTAAAGGRTLWLLVVAGLFVLAAYSVHITRELNVLRDEVDRLAVQLTANGTLPTIDIAGAPRMGSDDAVVVLVEYSDYECPFCMRYVQQTMPRIESDYVDTGRIQYVFRDFPIEQTHPEAIRAHEAARCAVDQGVFWPIHRRLFSPPGTHTLPQLTRLASEAGLDVGPFEACLNTRAALADIRRLVAEAVTLGARGTPAFYVGVRDPGTTEVRVLQRIEGAQPYEVFAQAIERVLDQQTGS